MALELYIIFYIFPTKDTLLNNRAFFIISVKVYIDYIKS